MDADRPSAPGRRTFLAGALAVAATACSSSSSPGAKAESTTTGSTRAAPPATTTTSAPGGPAQFVSRGPSTRERVALTFHTNGARSVAEDLLGVLARRKVHVTSFIVGTWLEANPDFEHQIADAGHELANHTYTHPTFPRLGRAAMTTEVTKCRDVLTRLMGDGGRWFRPSGTSNGTDSPSAQALAVAGEAGYPTVVGFDVDPADYRDPGAALISSRTLAAVTAGSIISLHFGHPGTVQAMPAILDGLDQRGLEPVTLSTLLGA